MPKITDELAPDSGFGKRFISAWKASRYHQSIQTELAQVFGVSKQNVSQWVGGHRYPHLSKGIEIAKAFDVTLDWLYTGREPRKPVDVTPFTKVGYRLMHLTHDQFDVIEFLVGCFERDIITSPTVRTFIMEQLRTHLAPPS